MIPISDHIHTRKKPLINYWLIGVNLVIFLWEIQLSVTGNLTNLINNWGIIPGQTNLAIYHAFFNNAAAWIVVFWRLLSLPISLFLHGSFSQILGNMLFLWVFGRTLEGILGRRTYLILFLTSGIFSGIVITLLAPNLTIPIVGSNAGIAAILGAYIMKFPKSKIYSVIPLLVVYIPTEVPVFLYLFWWFIQQSFYGIGSLNIVGGVNQSNVVYWGQFAALVTGAAFIKMRQRSS